MQKEEEVCLSHKREAVWHMSALHFGARKEIFFGRELREHVGKQKLMNLKISLWSVCSHSQFLLKHSNTNYWIADLVCTTSFAHLYTDHVCWILYIRVGYRRRERLIQGAPLLPTSSQLHFPLILIIQEILSKGKHPFPHSLLCSMMMF